MREHGLPKRDAYDPRASLFGESLVKLEARDGLQIAPEAGRELRIPACTGGGGVPAQRGSGHGTRMSTVAQKHSVRGEHP